MDKNDLLVSIFATVTALCAAETLLRLKDRNAAKMRFLRDRWTLEKTWEQFDSLSGWELTPGYISDDFRINKHGFRGPEFTRDKTCRVICLGDSVTFGSSGEKNTYPHIVQTEFEKKRTQLPVEVINAGVNGHSTYNMLFRINRIMKFKPDVVLVLAGWNDLFYEDIRNYQDNRMPFSSYWHIESRENIRSHLLHFIRNKAGYIPHKSIPISYSPDEFVPFNFEYNLKRIISLIQSKKVKTALLTLPKLISDDPDKITPAEKKKVILPDFLEDGNIEAFLKIYKSYDTIIKDVAAEKNIPIIDVDSMMSMQKRPRGFFFEDTCHLTSSGYKILGKFVAKSLLKESLIE